MANLQRGEGRGAKEEVSSQFGGFIPCCQVNCREVDTWLSEGHNRIACVPEFSSLLWFVNGSFLCPCYCCSLSLGFGCHWLPLPSRHHEFSLSRCVCVCVCVCARASMHVLCVPYARDWGPSSFNFHPIFRQAFQCIWSSPVQ